MGFMHDPPYIGEYQFYSTQQYTAVQAYHPNVILKIFFNDGLSRIERLFPKIGRSLKLSLTCILQYWLKSISLFLFCNIDFKHWSTDPMLGFVLKTVDANFTRCSFWHVLISQMIYNLTVILFAKTFYFFFF